MDVATLNLLIGGGIGIISGSIATIITYKFQSKLAEKKRDWDLSDFERVQELKIKQDRISQIENLAVEIYSIGSEFLSLWDKYRKEVTLRDEIVSKSLLISQKKNFLEVLSKLLNNLDLDSEIPIFSLEIEKFLFLAFSAVEEKDEKKFNIFVGQMGTIFVNWKKSLQRIIDLLDNSRYDAISNRI